MLPLTRDYQNYDTRFIANNIQITPHKISNGLTILSTPFKKILLRFYHFFKMVLTVKKIKSNLC